MFVSSSEHFISEPKERTSMKFDFGGAHLCMSCEFNCGQNIATNLHYT